jgi:hypothetical protein
MSVLIVILASLDWESDDERDATMADDIRAGLDGLARLSRRRRRRDIYNVRGGSESSIDRVASGTEPASLDQPYSADR